MLEIEKFQENEKNHEINRKKVKALANFSKTLGSFDDWAELHSIAKAHARGFLDPEQSAFIDYLLRKHEVDWTLWWCKPAYSRTLQKKTNRGKYLKEQIEKLCDGDQSNMLFPEVEEQKLADWESSSIQLAYRKNEVKQLGLL